MLKKILKNKKKSVTQTFPVNDITYINTENAKTNMNRSSRNVTLILVYQKK